MAYEESLPLSGEPRNPDRASNPGHVSRLIFNISRLNSKNYENYLEPMVD